MTVVSYDTLARNFHLGLIGLLAVVVAEFGYPDLPASMTLAILLAYLALGLFSLALASIQDARRYESGRAGHDLPLARHWWGTIGAIVTVLLLVALLVSQLFLPETLGRLAAGRATVLAFLGQILVWIILIVSYPVFLVLEWLAQFISHAPGGGCSRPRSSAPPSFAEQFGDLAQRSPASAPGPQEPLWIVGGLLVAALIVVIFLVAFRRFLTNAEEDVAEAHESILSLDLLKAQLARLLRRRGAGNGAAIRAVRCAQWR